MIDVIVIGAGPAGVLAALPAADLGAQTALVTRDEFGGMAANDGAVPVRTLAHAARLIRKARQLGQYGIAVSEPVTQVPTAGAAFYPSTAAVLAKLGSQTPRWKWPLRRWMTRLRAWPSAPEALASAFDFNRAPFFQSFVEVRVGGSANVVRLLLYGVDEQLHWHDLQVHGQVIPGGQDDRAFVEFRFPLAAADPKPSP